MNSGRSGGRDKGKGRENEVHRCSNASREYLVSGYLSLELMFLTEQLHYKHEQPRGEDV